MQINLQHLRSGMFIECVKWVSVLRTEIAHCESLSTHCRFWNCGTLKQNIYYNIDKDLEKEKDAYLQLIIWVAQAKLLAGDEVSGWFGEKCLECHSSPIRSQCNGTLALHAAIRHRCRLTDAANASPEIKARKFTCYSQRTDLNSYICSNTHISHCLARWRAVIKIPCAIIEINCDNVE